MSATSDTVNELNALAKELLDAGQTSAAEAALRRGERVLEAAKKHEASRPRSMDELIRERLGR